MIKKMFSFLSYLLGMALILGLVLFLSERENLKNQFIAYLTTELESQTGCHVDFQNVALHFPFVITADKVIVCQNGLQLQIQDLALRPNLWEILSHNIVLNDVRASRLALLHDDTITSVKSVPTQESTSDLHVGFKIKQLTIQKISIDQDLLLAHEIDFPLLASTIHLSGSGAFDPVSNHLLAELALSQEDSAPIKLIGVLADKHGQWDCQIRVNLPNGSMLKEFVPVDGYHYETIINTHISSTLDSIQGEFHLNYHVAEHIHPLLGMKGALHTDFAVDHSKVSFSKTKGIIGPFLLEGFGFYENKHLDSECSLLLYDQHWLEKCIDCHLHDGVASLKISGPLTDLIANFEAKLSRFVFKDQPFDMLNLQGKFQGSATGLKGFIDARCNYKTKKVQFTADMESDLATKMEFNHLSLASDFTQASGQITYLFNEELLLGSLEGHSDLFYFNKFLPQKVLGPFSIRAKFYENLQRKQAVDLSFMANSVESDCWHAENISSTTTLHSLWERPSGSLLVNCYNFSASGHNVVNITFDTAFDLNTKEWPFLLSCQHVEGSKLEIHSRGAWHCHNDRLKIFIQKLDGFWEELPYFLQDPVTVEVGPQLLQISPLFFTLEEGSFYAHCNIDKGQIHTLIRAENLPIKMASLFGPHLAAKGLLNTEISLSTTQSDIVGEAQLNIKEIKMAGLTTPQPLQMSLSASLTDHRLVCNGKLRGFGQNPIQLSGQIPLNISLDPIAISFDDQQDLAVNLHMEGRIEPLLEFFLPFGNTNFSGNMNILCSVAGRWNAPKITGTGTFSDLTYELLGLGASVKKGIAQIDIEDNRLNLTNFEAFSSDGKPVRGKGTALVDPQQNFPFDLSFQISDLPISPFEYFQSTVSGKLQMKGDASGASLNGKISTTSLNVTVPEQTSEMMHAINVTYINQPKDKPAPTRFSPTASGWPFHLNLDITIPDNGRIQGSDWSTLWKGHLLITGTSESPNFLGTCNLIRGEYRFNGKPFSIDQGTLTFGGDFEKKTSLYVIASRDLDTIRAEVIVKGPLSKPAITFRSNPPLPQREILSWILFNRGTAEISAFQGSQLNESITDLAAGNKQPDMLTKIRDGFGLDRIDISRENGLSNDMSLQVGKYLSRGFLVSVNRSITAETNRLAIEANLTKQFKVQAEVGDDSDAHLLLKWKKDY